MPSNERVHQFQNLTAELRLRRYDNPAEVAEVINSFVERGGMHSDDVLWDHTNAGLACNPAALLNLLEEAIGVGRVLQDRELARDVDLRRKECDHKGPREASSGVGAHRCGDCGATLIGGRHD